MPAFFQRIDLAGNLTALHFGFGITLAQVLFFRLESGQLDECALTMDDLRKTRQAFVGLLQGVYHPRIRYPGLASGQENAPERVAADEETPDLESTEEAAGD